MEKSIFIYNKETKEEIVIFLNTIEDFDGTFLILSSGERIKLDSNLVVSGEDWELVMNYLNN